MSEQVSERPLCQWCDRSIKHILAKMKIRYTLTGIEVDICGRHKLRLRDLFPLYEVMKRYE